ncbi:MAG: hypothetical protein ACRDKS_11790, partial [Actinomycetota bacterium]
MAKAAKALCDRCESRITVGVSFCQYCRYPTQWASHEERTTWELSQWKAGEAGGKATGRRSGGRASRWIGRPFARKKAPKPEWHLSLVPAASAAMPEAAATFETAPEAAAPVTVAAPAITREPSKATKPAP